MKKNQRSIVLSIVMVALACIVALPFYYIIVTTLKTAPDAADNPWGLPWPISFENYVNVFQTIPVIQGFLNSFYVTVLSVVVMLLIGSMAAYGILLAKGRFASILSAILIVGFIVPAQTTLIPLYRILAAGHLVDSLNGLVIIYSAGSIFCYFLIFGYMKTLPMELFEAARMDGASSLRIFRSIVLPLIRPILITVGIFQSMWVWNDFINPNVFINSPSKQTIVLMVYSAVGQFTTNWPVFMTLSVIALIPMVIFFIFAQRQLIAGIVSGGVKG